MFGSVAFVLASFGKIGPAVDAEAFGRCHVIEDQLDVTSPDVAGPQIRAEWFELIPEDLVAAISRWAGALLGARKISLINECAQL